MDIPPEVVVPICIERGSIYHFYAEIINSDGSTYEGNRFFVVLNVNPKTDEVLILTTITTKTVNQERYVKRIGESPETLVPITQADFPSLSSNSIVNCNKTYETSKEHLIQKIKDGGKFFPHKLPKTVIDALIQGVLISSQVPSEHKKKLI